MGGAVFLPSLLFALEILSPDGWSQIFPKWHPLEDLMLTIIPCDSTSNVIPPQQAMANPSFPGDTPRTPGRSDLNSYGDPAFPEDSVHMKPCVCPPRVESLFPQVWWSSYT